MDFRFGGDGLVFHIAGPYGRNNVVAAISAIWGYEKKREHKRCDGADGSRDEVVAGDIYNHVCMDAGGISFVLDGIEHIRHSPNIHHQTPIEQQIKRCPPNGGLFHSDNARYSASGVCINGARILVAHFAMLTQVQFLCGKFCGKSHGI